MPFRLRLGTLKERMPISYSFFSALIEFASVFTVAQIFILGRGSKVCELYRVCKYTT
jgi:hypothetical protein